MAHVSKGDEVTFSSVRNWSRVTVLALACGSASAFALTTAAADEAASHALKAGLSAYNLDNFVEALAHWQPIATNGEPNAQAALGYMSLMGKGVVPSRIPSAIRFNSPFIQMRNASDAARG